MHVFSLCSHKLLHLLSLYQVKSIHIADAEYYHAVEMFMSMSNIPPSVALCVPPSCLLQPQFWLSIPPSSLLIPTASFLLSHTHARTHTHKHTRTHTHSLSLSSASSQSRWPNCPHTHSPTYTQSTMRSTPLLLSPYGNSTPFRGIDPPPKEKTTPLPLFIIYTHTSLSPHTYSSTLSLHRPQAYIRPHRHTYTHTDTEDLVHNSPLLQHND